MKRTGSIKEGGVCFLMVESQGLARGYCTRSRVCALHTTLERH